MKLPDQGFVFWPVGCGDSTTICVEKGLVVQVDLNHMEKSDDEDDPATAIIDELVNDLPKANGKPFLSTFVLTHPDLDHCRGFAELLKKVTIGELWFSPRIFLEYKKDFCDDALVFRNEADRRVKKVINSGGSAGSGDRIRLIGYDDLLKEKEYSGFPRSCLSVPGTAVTQLNGNEVSHIFRAFVHAPFKGDCAGERNESSIALQVRLLNGSEQGNALLLGDLAYPTLKRIVEETRDSTNLHWNVLLAPHHCSKSAMYFKEEGQEEEELKQDILDAWSDYRQEPNWIVASSMPIPDSNEPGDNPPHAIAKEQYETITSEFHCTHEHIQEDVGEEMPNPIELEMTADGLVYKRPTGNTKARGDRVAAAVSQARGSNEPPKERVGFGQP